MEMRLPDGERFLSLVRTFKHRQTQKAVGKRIWEVSFCGSPKDLIKRIAAFGAVIAGRIVETKMGQCRVHGELATGTTLLQSATVKERRQHEVNIPVGWFLYFNSDIRVDDADAWYRLEPGLVENLSERFR